MVTNTGWAYVGEGRGNSNRQGYTYVGEGAGSYTKEAIAVPYGCRLRPCCLLLLPILLLPFLAYYLLSNPTAPTPKPIPAPAPLQRIPVPIPAPVRQPPAFGPFGTCIGWGDPHVRTFDGTRADYYSSGEYYIVKSPVVSIQGRYLPTKFTNGLAVTKMV